MKPTLWMQINIKVFNTLILPFLVGVVRHTQIANQISEYFKGQYVEKDALP